MLTVAFIEAPGQSHAAADLTGVLAEALAAGGAAVERCADGFPVPRDGLAYVLIGPSEYFERRPAHPPDFLLHRTVLICTEPLGSPGWENEAATARAAGAVFATAAQGVRELRRRGIEARHLALGRVPAWERAAAAPREVDVCFAGPLSPHRSAVLARLAGPLASRRTELALWDEWRQAYAPASAALAASSNLERLHRARVALAIPYGDVAAFDTLLAVQAAHAGTALVSQGSAGAAPWRPGRDFLDAPPDELAARANGMLDDEEARRGLCEAARARLDELPPLAAVAAAVLEAAESTARRQWSSAPPGFDASDPLFAVPSRDPVPPPPLAVTDDPRESSERRTRKRAALRALAAARSENGDGAAPLEHHRSPAYDAAAPRVSVLVSLYDYADRVTTALDSAASGTYSDLEVVVVDDASRDDSLARAREWMKAHDDVPARLVAHARNRGVAHARNTAIALARGELALILDADNTLYPRGLERLVDALDRDPAAAFAYGLLERFTDQEGPLDLGNVGPWDPVYLRTINYVDALALIRVAALRELRGYTTDLRLYGWEDYDLWCAMAERGAAGAWIPEVVARYRVSPESMLRSVTTISNTEAFEALIERHPALMAGLTPPL